MENIKKIIAVWKYQSILGFFQVKIWIAFIVLFFYIRSYTEPIVSFARAVNMKVNPFLFPLLMNDWMFPIIIALFFLLLICDAPFIKKGYLFLVFRTGKLCWLIGESIFLFTYAVFYTVIVCLLTILNTIPQIGFDLKWGKVIMTLIRTDASIQFNTIELSQVIAEKFDAIEALSKTFILCTLALWLIAILVFAFNYIMKNYIGVMLGGIIIFLDLAIYNLFDTYALRKYSPISFMKLSLMVGKTKYSLSYLYVIIEILSICFFLVTIMGIYTFKKKGVNFTNTRREL